jgi:hypothetical protein
MKIKIELSQREARELVQHLERASHGSAAFEDAASRMRLALRKALEAKP